MVRKKSGAVSKLLPKDILSESVKRVVKMSGPKILKFWCYFELSRANFQNLVQRYNKESRFSSFLSIFVQKRVHLLKNEL